MAQLKKEYKSAEKQIKMEGFKYGLNNTDILEVNTFNDQKFKTSEAYESFKQLFKGLIDEKLNEKLKDANNKDITFEDVAKDLFMQIKYYIPLENDIKSSGDLKDKKIENRKRAKKMESKIHLPMKDFKDEDIDAISAHHHLRKNIDENGNGLYLIGSKKNLENFLDSFYIEDCAEHYKELIREAKANFFRENELYQDKLKELSNKYFSDTDEIMKKLPIANRKDFIKSLIKILKSKLNVLEDLSQYEDITDHISKEYRYITNHGIGPGTIPNDAGFIRSEDLDNGKTAIYLSRYLTADELKKYDIKPEWIQESKRLKKENKYNTKSKKDYNDKEDLNSAIKDDKETLLNALENIKFKFNLDDTVELVDNLIEDIKDKKLNESKEVDILDVPVEELLKDENFDIDEEIDNLEDRIKQYKKQLKVTAYGRAELNYLQELEDKLAELEYYR